MPLCEHPWYGVANCRQELHATISSVVVSRYTRFDSLVDKHIALFLWTTNLEAVSVLLLLLMCIYPPSPQTYTFNFNSLVFHSRVFSAPEKCYCCTGALFIKVRKYLSHERQRFATFHELCPSCIKLLRILNLYRCNSP